MTRAAEPRSVDGLVERPGAGQGDEGQRHRHDLQGVGQHAPRAATRSACTAATALTVKVPKPKTPTTRTAPTSAPYAAAEPRHERTEKRGQQTQAAIAAPAVRTSTAVPALGVPGGPRSSCRRPFVGGCRCCAPDASGALVKTSTKSGSRRKRHEPIRCAALSGAGSGSTSRTGGTVPGRCSLGSRKVAPTVDRGHRAHRDPGPGRPL